MLNCIAIDDEPKALDIVELYANKIPFLHLAARFRDALEALNYLNQHNIDLLFLDINMPDLNGIEFLQSLQTPPIVIFTTAYSEYAVQSYDFEAVDYLLKPFSFSRFLKAVNRANEIQAVKKKTTVEEDDNTNIIVKSGSDKFTIKIKDILFIEGAQNYIFIHTPEKKIMTLMRLKDIEKTLPEELFCRVHKSFIVALNKVDKIEPSSIQIKEAKVPIGKIYKELFTRKNKLDLEIDF